MAIWFTRSFPAPRRMLTRYCAYTVIEESVMGRAPAWAGRSGPKNGKVGPMSEFRRVSLPVFIGVVLISGVATALVTALLMNIFERKIEAKNPFVRLVEVTEDDTDPEKWGINWPKQYDSYLRTAMSTRTRFGGHGGWKWLGS